MSLVRSILRPAPQRAESYTLEDYYRWTAGMWPLFNQTWETNRESIEADFAGLVSRALHANGIVFACELTRASVFSQARLQFQQLRGGTPGEYFGTPDLRPLEQPEPNRMTADLLTWMLLDHDYGGDAFPVRRPGGRIKRLRPDWVDVVIGSPNVDADTPADDPDAEEVGIVYYPGGRAAPTSRPWTFAAGEYAHFYTLPDPLAKFRGVPLVTSVVREITGDSAATTHKNKFWEHAATPNLVIRYPAGMDAAKVEKSIAIFEQEHAGVANAYRTAYLAAGAEAQVVGQNLRQMDFKAVQGAGETRIAAAMGVHPVVVGLSEGLGGSSLNAGNFQAAIRLTAGKTWYPLWNNVAGSLGAIVPPLPGTQLAADTRGIAILAESVKDAAEALSVQATAMRTLGDGGWDHDAVVDAVTSGDLRRLAAQHTGLVPVQLQQPGAAQVQALADFWPDGAYSQALTVRRGDRYTADHPLFRTYPSLFGPADERNAA